MSAFLFIMDVEKFSVKTCCGKMSILFKLNGTISEDLLNKFKSNGYIESPILTKAGILYVDNSEASLTGAFGSNNLQIKCKKDNCEENFANL